VVAEIEIRKASTRPREHLALTYTAASGLQIQEAPEAQKEEAAERPTPIYMFGAPQPAPQKEDAFEYRDVRDDAVHTYFGLAPGARARFRISLNASYAGRYYLPAVRVEDMYEPAVQAVATGRWLSVRDVPQSAAPAGASTAELATP
jgi:uncharacterized protein YfaS (alpha-2-macroglobulin family)